MVACCAEFANMATSSEQIPKLEVQSNLFRFFWSNSTKNSAKIWPKRTTRALSKRHCCWLMPGWIKKQFPRNWRRIWSSSWRRLQQSSRAASTQLVKDLDSSSKINPILLEKIASRVLSCSNNTSYKERAMKIRNRLCSLIFQLSKLTKSSERRKTKRSLIWKLWWPKSKKGTTF